MKPRFLIKLSGTLGVLLLSLPLPLRAGERVAAPSPYRLSAHDASAAASSGAPYLLDQRYRLATAVDVSLPEKPYARQVDEAAHEAGVDPALVHALIFVESAYQPRAVSPKGALGLMQVMPETALRYGVDDASEVRGNLRAGARHLRRLIDRYEDRLDLVLAAYNAGEGAVSRYNNSIPPYAETQRYVPAVIARYRAARPLPTKVRPAPDYLPGTRLDPLALSRLP